MENVKFFDVKKTISELEKDGLWNEAINLLASTWEANRDSERVCSFFVGECYWLINEREFYEDLSESERPIGWSSIEWNFEGKMLSALENGLDKFSESPWFLCSIGYLADVNESHFLGVNGFQTIAHVRRILKKAYELEPGNIFYRVVCAQEECLPKLIDIDGLKLQIDDMGFKKTLSDINMFNFIVWRLKVHYGIEVDWRIPD